MNRNPLKYPINLYVSESCSDYISYLQRQAAARGVSLTISEIVRSMITAPNLTKLDEIEVPFQREPRHRFRVRLTYPQVLDLDIWAMLYHREHGRNPSRGQIVQALFYERDRGFL